MLTHLYPNGDVAVVQMSLDRTKAPEHHFELGKQLDVLRQRGILIVGSGNTVHNLRLADFKNAERPNHGLIGQSKHKTSSVNSLPKGTTRT